jgi:hypothetical protein
MPGCGRMTNDQAPNHKAKLFPWFAGDGRAALAALDLIVELGAAARAAATLELHDELGARSNSHDFVLVLVGAYAVGGKGPSVEAFAQRGNWMPRTCVCDNSVRQEQEQEQDYD